MRSPLAHLLLIADNSIEIYATAALPILVVESSYIGRQRELYWSRRGAI